MQRDFLRASRCHCSAKLPAILLHFPASRCDRNRPETFVHAERAAFSSKFSNQQKVHRVGLEPTTKRLRVSCSTIELAMRGVKIHSYGGNFCKRRAAPLGSSPSNLRKSEQPVDYPSIGSARRGAHFSQAFRSTRPQRRGRPDRS